MDVKSRKLGKLGASLHSRIALDNGARFCDSSASVSRLTWEAFLIFVSRHWIKGSPIMVVRIASILPATLILLMLADVRPARCDGWNPFASSDANTITTHKPATKVTKKEPSTLDKVGTGTKNFFNKTGETLGLKKPEPKKPSIAFAKPPRLASKKKTESTSWLPSFLKPEEPKKPKTVEDWMSRNTRVDP
jgi:hypothetical protein